MTSSGILNLDIGAGSSPKKGYASVDLYANADYQDDITTLATFDDNVADSVYTAHVLEHLKNDAVALAMNSVFRVLKPGGAWRIEVPDLLWIIQDFLATPEEKRWGWKLQTLFGLQNHEGEFHRTGFSDERLGKLLIRAGFVRIRLTQVFSKRYNQGVIRALAYKPEKLVA